MKNKITPFVVVILFSSLVLTAQVPVSEEPLHHNVFQNKYIRLLDVWMQPRDTSLYHIHATPSLFVYLSATVIGTQIKGEGWAKEQSITGKAWYRSFSPDILVHRVCNSDSVALHVNDIEILSSYKPSTQLEPLPFTILFENGKAVAYQLTNSSFNRQVISNRGPMIAELAIGEGVNFYDVRAKQSTEIKRGKYLYIEPGTSFYFTTTGASEINMVLFEIK